MVRSLLKERFQFAAHVKKRKGQVYSLVVARLGVGLKPRPQGVPYTLSTVKANKYPHMSPSYDAVPAHCGIFGRELRHRGEHRFGMFDVTMQQIADWLALGGLPLPLSVTDQIGLTGRYDAVLDFGPDGMRMNAGSSDDEIGLPPLAEALEKQLGLKLVKQNAQVDVLAIDHIEKLSEN